jgi:hypothetical protein
MKVSIECRKINQVKTALTATTAYSEGCIEGRPRKKLQPAPTLVGVKKIFIAGAKMKLMLPLLGYILSW